jgi:hypothetical protein
MRNRWSVHGGKNAASVALAALIVAVSLLPARTTAQQLPPGGGPPINISVSVPPEASKYVPEQDLVLLIYEFTLWRSGEFLARLEAVDETLTPLFQAMRETVGVDIKLPDTSAIRKQAKDAIEQVGRSKTVAEAQQHLNRLAQLGTSVGDAYSSLKVQAAPLQQGAQAKGKEIESKVSALMQQEAARMQADIQKRIQAKATAKSSQIAAQAASAMQSYIMAQIAQTRDPAAMAGIAGQAQAYASQLMAQLTSELQTELNTEAKAAEQDARAQLQKRLDELIGDPGKALARIQELSGDVDQRLEALTKQKLAAYDVYKDRALTRLRDTMRKVMEGELARAEALIKKEAPAASALPPGSAQGLDRDTLLARVQQDRQALSRLLGQANSQQEFAEAAASLQARWAGIQKELERTRVQETRQAMDQIKAKLDEAKAASQLAAAVEKTDQGIQVLERMQRQQGKLDAKNADSLKKLKLLKGELQQANSLVQEFNREYAKNPPTLSIQQLLDLKDLLQTKLEAIERAVKDKSLIPSSAGVFIEAENEARAELLPRDVEWASTKEINPRWRPKPMSGNAVWYLSRGGETLYYFVNAPLDGSYSLWVRDLNDGRQAESARSITVTIDGKRLGDFPPSSNIGPWTWHKITTVTLSAGQHQMNVTKTATTSAAAQLDAFYFTTDPNETPKDTP